MKVERITDIQGVLKCLPFEQEIRKKGRDNTREADLLGFMQEHISDPLLGFWMAYDDEDNVVGYLVGLMNPRNKGAYFLRIYAPQKDVFKNLEKTAREWMKQYKTKKMYITIRKNIKAFQRMGWEAVSVNMERRT